MPVAGMHCILSVHAPRGGTEKRGAWMIIR